MKKLLLAVSFFVLSFPLISQIKLGVKDLNSYKLDYNPIELTDLSVDVSVLGNVATTTMDMVFYNSSNVVLEGEFEFPLAEGQTVSGYALEITGKLRKGVVVDKDKGREVFEDIVRKNADPGLIEMTKGNNFKTRIYPLNPMNSRHIQISYEQALSTQKNPVTGQLEKKYILNPIISSPVKSFKFNINVYSLDGQAQDQSSDESTDIVWRNGINSKFERTDFSFEQPIEIVMPQAIEELAVYTQEEGVDSYFYYYSYEDALTAQKPIPEKLTALFDVSASAKNRQLQKELDLLQAYIEKTNAELEVAVFSNKENGRKNFGKVTDFEQVKDFIVSFGNDGATNFSGLDFASYSGDEILLFSDGIANWLSTNPKKAEVSVTTINSAYSSDSGYLKLIAKENNGDYINLNSVTVEQALAKICSEPFRLITVDYDESKLSEVYPLPGTIINSDFSLSGILTAKEAKITLGFGYGTKVLKKTTVKVSAVRDEGIAMPENIIRLWAQKKIDELSVEYDKNKKQITETAKTFGILTKDTSLLVLDSVRDYIKYGVLPPPELLDEFNRLTRNNTISFKHEVEMPGLPKEVYVYFDSFKKWWLTTPEEFIKQARRDRKKRNAAVGTVDRVPGAIASTRASAAVEDFEFAEEPMVVEEAAPRLMASNAIDSADVDVGANPRTALDSAASAGSIYIKPWTPSVEYLAVLKRTSNEKMFAKYLSLKEEYEDAPSFYMDVADYFIKEELPEEGMRILSNLAELKLENTDILRALGNKLIENKYFEEAVWIFEQLVKLRPEIPVFYRDLGLAYNYVGEYQKAVNSLYHIVETKWDSRFAEIQQIALNDMNAIIAANTKQIDTTFIDRKVMENFPVDIRIVLTWNTDDCDIDLWVTDPNNEKCYYGHKQTLIGGHNTRDFTLGYGPEEFCLRKAIKGTYKIQADYYGTRTQKILQPVVVQAEVYTNFGTPEQKLEILTLQLESIKGNYTVGELDFQ